MSLLPWVRCVPRLIDNCIVFGPTNDSIEQVVTDLRASSRKFTVDDQVDVGDFLGIQIQKQEDG